MKRNPLFLLVALVFVLVSCTGAEQVMPETVSDPIEVESAPTEVAEALPTEIPEEKPQEPEPTSTPESGDDAMQPVASEIVSECTLVSSLADPPQQYAELFAVKENDWVVGPEDAAITLVEYGDFQ